MSRTFKAGDVVVPTAMTVYETEPRSFDNGMVMIKIVAIDDLLLVLSNTQGRLHTLNLHTGTPGWLDASSVRAYR